MVLEDQLKEIEIEENEAPRSRSLSSTMKKGEKLDRKQTQLQMKQKLKANQKLIVGNKDKDPNKG